MKKLLLFIALVFPLLAKAQQPWSGIIDTTRAINWSQSGVTGGIPDATWAQCVTTACNAVISAGSAVTTTQIQSAIISAPANTYVLLPTGNLVMSAGINMRSNVVLRGQGALSTTLDFSGVGASTGAAPCQPIPVSDICLGNGDSTGLTPPGGTNTATWTAGYAQGATSITLASLTGIGITNGQYIFLDQVDTTADNGNFFMCNQNTGTSGQPANNGGPCTLESGPVGRGTGSGHRQESQTVKVVSGCATACNGAGPFTVTISPGIYFPNIASAQSPAAWWPANPVQFAGLENFTVINSIGGQVPANIGMANAFNCWVTGVRSETSYRDHVWMYQSGFNTVQNNYFWGTVNATTTSYGTEQDVSSGSLVTNNIYQKITTALIYGTGTGNVISYNYEIYGFNNGVNAFGAMGMNHDSAAYNLYEGNFVQGLVGDAFHGTGGFHTAFRNSLSGWEPTFANSLTATQVAPYNRYVNLIGNVMGTPGMNNTYQTTTIFGGTTVGIFVVGMSLNEKTVTIPADPLSVSSLMRWGNYDAATQTSRFLSSEVPSGISPYGNAVPANQTLPSSFYLSGRPSFWPSTKAFPPIGPDVTGGNVGQCTGGSFPNAFALSSGACTGGTFASGTQGGRIYSIPAMDCYFNVMNGTTDGTGNVLSFNASSCYTSSGGGVVSASPLSVGFGSVTQNTTSPAQTITVTNQSGSTVTFSGTTLSGANATDFSLPSNACTGSLANGSNCKATAAFTPTAPIGTNELATVNFAFTGASGSPASSSLTGTSAGTTFVLQNSQNGACAAGSTNCTVNLTTTKAGTALIAYMAGFAGTTAIALASVTDGGDVFSTCTALGGSSCNGTLSGTGNLDIRAVMSGAGGKTSLTCNLTVAPTLAWLCGAYELQDPGGFIFVGSGNFSSSTSSTTFPGIGFTFTGSKNSAIQLSSGGGNQTGINGGYTLSGVDTAYLLSTSNGTAPTWTQSPAGTQLSAGLAVTVGGGGGTPALTITPSSLAFGSINVGQSSSSQPVNIQNQSTASVNISSIAVADTVDYSQTNNCPATLIVGNSCTVNVTFKPQSIGSLPSSLVVTSNGTGSPQSVSLSGTGIQAIVTVGIGSLPGSGPGTVVFGAQPQALVSGIGTIQVSNTGTGNLVISSVTVTGTPQFALVTPTSGSDCRTIGTVAPSSSCFLGATFNPTLPIPYTGTITIVDNAPGSPHQIALSGTGFASAGPAPAFAKN